MFLSNRACTLHGRLVGTRAFWRIWATVASSELVVRAAKSADTLALIFTPFPGRSTTRLLRQLPEGAGEGGFIEHATNRGPIPSHKAWLGAAAVEELRQGVELRGAHDAVALWRRAEPCLVEPRAQLVLVREDEQLVVSGGDQVVVPLAQRRAEADHRRSRAAAHHLAVDERLGDCPPGAVAGGPEHGRRTFKHDVLPPEIPVSVAVQLRARDLEERPREQRGNRFCELAERRKDGIAVVIGDMRRGKVRERVRHEDVALRAGSRG